MLVHDGRKNETMVIDFGETAPSTIQEEMLQHDLQHKVLCWAVCTCSMVHSSDVKKENGSS